MNGIRKHGSILMLEILQTWSRNTGKHPLLLSLHINAELLLCAHCCLAQLVMFSHCVWYLIINQHWNYFAVWFLIRLSLCIFSYHVTISKYLKHRKVNCITELHSYCLDAGWEIFLVFSCSLWWKMKLRLYRKLYCTSEKQIKSNLKPWAPTTNSIFLSTCGDKSQSTTVMNRVSGLVLDFCAG